MTNGNGLIQGQQLNEAPSQMTSADIEQAIERIGARYIADLRTLSNQFSRFYHAQLAAKDQQIAELRQRLESVGRERALLEAQVHDLKQIGAKYIADMHVLSEELSRHIENQAYTPADGKAHAK